MLLEEKTMSMRYHTDALPGCMSESARIMGPDRHCLLWHAYTRATLSEGITEEECITAWQPCTSLQCRPQERRASQGGMGARGQPHLGGKAFKRDR